MNELYTIENNTNTPKLFKKCPYCDKEVNFLPLKNLMDVCGDYTEFSDDDCNRTYFGIRECSNPECNHILAFKFKFIANRVSWDSLTGEDSYSEEIIDFETLPKINNCTHFDYIPENIRLSFDEAQKCFYNECFVASAIMIRKTLEEICENFEIEGRDLNNKLNNLIESDKIPSLIGEEIHELRRFGNDGAHLQLRFFNNIGEKEVKTALEVIKNMLIIIYESNQNYKNSVNKLQSLKSSASAD